jgi:hypothetical protein
VDVLAIRCFYIRTDTPHDRIPRINSKACVTICKADEYLRINSTFSKILKTSRHISTPTAIELERDFFSTIKLVMFLDFRICIKDVNFLGATLLNNS